MWYIYIHTIEYYSAIKMNEILPVATWMDLEGVMLSEISQRKISTISFHSYIKFKKQNKQRREQKRKNKKWTLN